ncbi:MAG: AAA family ATPase [Bradyrhizobiaceae bacterium]|nr:AAA family ATPase [Bradyrhizobiaceae bacterium]
MTRQRKRSRRDSGLIGRAREAAMLGKLIRNAAAGRGATVFICGEAGIGKTALLDAALAGAGLVEIRAAASAVGGGPLAPVASLLHALKRNMKGAPADKAEAVLRVLAASGGQPGTPANRAAQFSEIGGVFAAAAHKQPLAVVIDDAHWADHATLEFLPHLAEIARSEPMLVAVAFRDDEVPRGHPMRAAREAVRRAGRLEEIELRPLNGAETAELVLALAGASPPDLVETVAGRSGGIPLFVEALVGILKQHDGINAGAALASLPLPDTIRDAVLMRVDLLSPAGRQAAETAAAGGSALDLRLLAEISGEESGIEELLEANVLVEQDGGLAGFRTQLAREAVYSAIPWTRRRALHRRYAEALARRDSDASSLADHWLKAGEGAKACRALLEGAARSRTLHAHRDAVQLLRCALDIWPQGFDEQERLAALDQLGDCAQLAGRLAEAAQAWREVADSAAGAQSFAAAGRALRKLANLHELNCDWSRAIEARQEAIVAFAAAGEPAEAALEGITAAIRLRMSARYGAALEILVRASADAEAAVRADLKVRIEALKGNIEARSGLVDEGVAATRAALEKALALENPALAGEVYQRLADAIERSSRHKQAASVGQTGISFCNDHGLAGPEVACLTCMGWILVRSGDWEEALDASRQILASPACVPPARLGALLFIGLVQVFRGDLKNGEGSLLEAEAIARRVDHALGTIHSSWGLAVHAAIIGNLDSATQRFRSILARLDAIDVDHAFIPVLRSAATCLAHAGDKKGLQVCGEVLGQSAAAFSNPEPLSALAHMLGEIAWLDGDVERAAGQFERAVSLIEDWDLPRERIESQLRAAAACAALDKPAAAADFARAAARGAERLGARPLVQAARAQLRALGQPLDGARGARRAAQGGLTVRQREILASIARGLTDKEIARALRLSPRTVEMHVAHVLTALDCRNRAEAVRKATEAGVLPARGG